MRRTQTTPHLLLPALALCSGIAQPQARGPTYEQVREIGLHIPGERELREQAARLAAEQAEQERIALLDPAERARRFAALDAILRRLPGRFRIDGRLERPIGPGTNRTREITGIADCMAIGGGVGLNCIINASWPTIEDPLPVSRFTPPVPPPSEALNTMRPAVLVVGLNIDPPGIRAMMVTADTVTYNWVGGLEGESALLRRTSRCRMVRCYQQFELVAAPDDKVVSLVLKGAGLTFNLTMHPDPEATSSKPLKPLRVR